MSVIEKSELDWRSELTEEQFEVLRKKATEAPFSGEYHLHFDKGDYFCAGCGQKLFGSDAKFKSSCGWPSFDKAIAGSVEFVRDMSYGMVRTEVLCSNCGGHLGHVFRDGPTETRVRFCINSISLNFSKQ